jgi:hypothetical protein
VEVIIDPNSKRLEKLEPFLPWDGKKHYRCETTYKSLWKVYNRSYLNGRSVVEI